MFELADVENVIENEIHHGLSQVQIAQTYALAMRSSWPTDWGRVNAAIIGRWGDQALLRIKKMAHEGTCFSKHKEAAHDPR